MSIQSSRLGLTLCLVLCSCNTGPGSGSVTITGGKSDTVYVDHTLAGTGLKRFEGRPVVVLIGHPFSGERKGEGRAQVTGWSFRIDFPAVRELGLYKGFVVFFDMDGDGKCTPGVDMGHQGATGGIPDPYVQWVEESSISVLDAKSCQPIL